MNSIASPTQLVNAIIEGEKWAIGQAITHIENDTDDGRAIYAALYRHLRAAYRIGVTGPPGVGKSTLTNELAKSYRQRGYMVGIIVIDPTSPFSGGALLGDRLRMAELESDEGIFIRSMASRGSLGGLSRKAVEAADILDVGGMDIIFVETVGVGQSELDIAEDADTTLVLLIPESGDSIQAMKAGLMEVADILVLNKCDRPGAEEAFNAINLVFGSRPHGYSQSSLPALVRTQASAGTGVEDLIAQIEIHRKHLEDTDGLVLRRNVRARRHIRKIINHHVLDAIWKDKHISLLQDAALQLHPLGDETPYSVARLLQIELLKIALEILDPNAAIRHDKVNE